MQKSFTFAEGAYKIQDDFDGCKITAYYARLTKYQFALK